MPTGIESCHGKIVLHSAPAESPLVGVSICFSWMSIATHLPKQPCWLPSRHPTVHAACPSWMKSVLHVLEGGLRASSVAGSFKEKAMS